MLRACERQRMSRYAADNLGRPFGRGRVHAGAGHGGVGGMGMKASAEAISQLSNAIGDTMSAHDASFSGAVGVTKRTDEMPPEVHSNSQDCKKTRPNSRS